MRTVRLVGRRTGRAVAAVTVAAVCVACGSTPATTGGASTSATHAAGTTASRPPNATNQVDAGYTGRFTTSVTVLEKQGSGPQLCLSGVLDSLPPQCGGPKVQGWSWDVVTHETRGDVRWGEYRVVGRFDGTTFTLTEPAAAAQPPSPVPPDPVDNFVTPCPTPAGGWKAVDKAKAKDENMTAVDELARKQPGYGYSWIDLKPYVFNIMTTGDLAAMTRIARTVWGGALCVTKAPRTDAELRATDDGATALAVASGASLLGSRTQGRSGTVMVDVMRATTQLQQQLDARYGAGVVRLVGALRPID